MVVVSFCFSSYLIWFYFYHLFSRCKHTTWETTIAKLNIKKSEDLKEKAFCIPENFLKDARHNQPIRALTQQKKGLADEIMRFVSASPYFLTYFFDTVDSQCLNSLR